MRRFALVVFAVTLLSGSVAQAASYLKTDGTIGDPILLNSGGPHGYNGNNLSSGTNLAGANLSFAALWYANLSYADLNGANLYYANLEDANLHGANLTDANLRGAWLINADLTNANLTNADLTKANLYYANLSNADLSNANLTGAALWYANLSYANLYYAALWYANLANADLSNADLSNANLSFAALWYANLSYADLYGANLTGASYVEDTTGTPYYYGNTVLPSGFDPAAQGWILAPYCDFTPDAACDLADINQMFETGDLVTGVAVAGSTDRLDLVDNDTIDAADISEWLSQAATANGFGSAYLRGDTDLDRDIDLTDYNALVTNFDPLGADGPYLWQDGNTDGDNDVDLADYNAVASNFQPLGYGAAAVPEPATALLALLGMLLFSVFGRLSVLS